MQSSSAAVGTPGAPPMPQVAAHFASLEVQHHAARLGMWLFLATEILLFAGLFVIYANYRFLFPDAFAAASRELNLLLGSINTLVLITSSFTAAMAVHYAKEAKNKMVVLMFGSCSPSRWRSASSSSSTSSTPTSFTWASCRARTTPTRASSCRA
jgi:cytochrome c oxidase subunit III